MMNNSSAILSALLLPDGKPNPDNATEVEIAEHCGIKPWAASDYAVPVLRYRNKGGAFCEASGRRPDPPRLVVARYELPDGERMVLTHKNYADRLASAYPRLTGPQAEAFALYRAGWRGDDFYGVESPLGNDQYDAPDLIADAKAIVND